MAQTTTPPVIEQTGQEKSSAGTAKLVLDGKEYELPVIVGSEGEKAIDISRLRAQNIEVALARLEAEGAAAAAARAGLLAALGKDRLFHSVEEAVQALAPGHSDRGRAS